MQAMLLDGQYYSDPLQFHGFRFADETRPIGYLPPEPSKFTDVSDSWFVWGAGNKSWYISTKFPGFHGKLY